MCLCNILILVVKLERYLQKHDCAFIWQRTPGLATEARLIETPNSTYHQLRFISEIHTAELPTLRRTSLAISLKS